MPFSTQILAAASKAAQAAVSKPVLTEAAVAAAQAAADKAAQVVYDARMAEAEAQNARVTAYNLLKVEVQKKYDAGQAALRAKIAGIVPRAPIKRAPLHVPGRK